MTKDLRTLVPAAEARSRARVADETLRTAAEAAGEIDVALGTLDSPIGELWVAVTPRGLACIAFDGQNRDALAPQFASVLSPRV